MSLSQGSLSLFSILLLAEGRTAYMGSRTDAIQYFDRYLSVLVCVLAICGKCEVTFA